MKKFEVYRYLDGNGEEVALQGGMKDSDYYLGDIEANTYKEAVIKAYENTENVLLGGLEKTDMKVELIMMSTNMYTK